MTNAAFADRYGPVALVTGASSGIGKAFAEALAARGIDLIVTARRTDRLKDLAARLTDAHSVSVRVEAVDLADPAAAGRLVEAAASLDVGLLVSNAGFGLKGPFAAADPKAVADMLTVNCHAPLQLARGFTPRLQARGRGGVIFTSSIEALMGIPNSAAYSATKALVNAFGEALWAEVRGDGVDVLTLCPGATESEAAGLQGIDIRALHNVMPARDVAEATLDNLKNGPTFFSSAYYRENFDKLLSMPRADALVMMMQMTKSGS